MIVQAETMTTGRVYGIVDKAAEMMINKTSGKQAK